MCVCIYIIVYVCWVAIFSLVIEMNWMKFARLRARTYTYTHSLFLGPLLVPFLQKKKKTNQSTKEE